MTDLDARASRRSLDVPMDLLRRRRRSDLGTLRDGLTSSVRAAADSAGAFFGRAPTTTSDAPTAVHQKPPTPEWDADERRRARAGERARTRLGRRGAPTSFDRGDGAKSKYATSYSWDNPPPRPRDEEGEDEEGDEAKEKTPEELFGMDTRGEERGR